MQLTRSQNCILSFFIASNSFHTLVHFALSFLLQQCFTLCHLWGELIFISVRRIMCSICVCRCTVHMVRMVFNTVIFSRLHHTSGSISPKLTLMHDFMRFHFIFHWNFVCFFGCVMKYVKNGWLACK